MAGHLDAMLMGLFSLGFIATLVLRVWSRHWSIMWSLRVFYAALVGAVLRINYIGFRYMEPAIQVFHGASLGNLDDIILKDDSPVRSQVEKSERIEEEEKEGCCTKLTLC